MEEREKIEELRHKLNDIKQGQDGVREVLLVINRYEIKEVVCKRRAKGRKKLKVVYININGLTSVQRVINVYLTEFGLDIVGIVETKLTKGIVLHNLGE